MRALRAALAPQRAIGRRGRRLAARLAGAALLLALAAAHARSAGTPLRTIGVDQSPGAMAVTGDGRAFVLASPPGSWTGGVALLVDARRAMLVGTAAVGARPVAAAVDARVGLVFVANSADDTLSVLDAYSDPPEDGAPGDPLEAAGVGSQPAVGSTI